MVTEGVWDNRYRYVGELTRMGAQIRVEGRSAVIEGVDHLTAASVQAYDLRAGAAMVIAALAAEGTSEVSNVHYIERGYEDIIGKLRNLGAQIDSVECDETVETRQIG
jgi:UDP-N-acetylglucosamine 1-carboxyvinyltransferase